MQAIETEYRGPTDRRGARVIARAQAGRVVVPWDHALSIEENHDAACQAFVRRRGWFGAWIRGNRADDRGYVYVCMQRGRNGYTRTPHPQAVSPSDYFLVCG